VSPLRSPPSCVVSRVHPCGWCVIGSHLGAAVCPVRPLSRGRGAAGWCVHSLGLVCGVPLMCWRSSGVGPWSAGLAAGRQCLPGCPFGGVGMWSLCGPAPIGPPMWGAGGRSSGGSYEPRESFGRVVAQSEGEFRSERVDGRPVRRTSREPAVFGRDRVGERQRGRPGAPLSPGGLGRIVARPVGRPPGLWGGREPGVLLKYVVRE
jgi:hypothetical protein